MYTLDDLRENPNISAIVYNAGRRQGCRLWGTAEIIESGDKFDKLATEAAVRGITLNHLVKVAVDEEVAC